MKKLNNAQRLIVVYGLMGIGANLAHPVTPQLLKSLHLSSAVFGYAYAAMVLGSFLFSPFWGNLCNYVQPKKLLFISCLGYGSAQALFGLANTFESILVARLLAGFFVSASGVAAVFLLTRLKGEYDNKALIPTLITCFTVLGTFGQFIGGFIGEYNIKYPFIIQVIVLYCCAILFLTWMDTIDLKQLSSVKEVVKKSNPFKSFIEVKKYLNPLFATQFISAFLLSFGAVSFSQSFGYYVADVFNLGPSINGNVRGVAGILAIALNFYITPKIIRSKTVEQKASVVASSVFVAITSMLLFHENHFLFISLAVFMISLDSMLVSISQERSNSYATKENQGVILGTHNSMRGLGGIFGSLCSGVIYKLSALNPFYLTAMLYFLAILSLHALAKLKQEYTNAQ